MQTLFASILLVTLAACGGGSTSSTTPQHPTETATVDPTVPSWLPESCLAYHKAVVQAIDCKAVEQSKRDSIKSSFDATSVSWKAEQNADDARVNEIRVTCASATVSVRDDIANKCI